MARVIAFDTETALIRPARLAPPLVCVTWQEFVDGVATDAGIEHHASVEPRLRGWLEEKNLTFAAHNTAFDLAVISERFPSLRSLVFDAYRQDRVTDTMLREQLLDIAGGRYRWHPTEKGKGIRVNYDLASVARRRAGLHLKKDGFRYFYGFFIDVLLERWVEHARLVQARGQAFVDGALDAEFAEHRYILDDKWPEAIKGLLEADPEEVLTYPIEDSMATGEVYLAQEEHVDELEDQHRQGRAAWWLHLSATWGLRTTPKGVASLKARTEHKYKEVEAELIAAELVRPDGTRNTKAAKRLMIRICREGAFPIRRTDTHGTPGKCKDLDGRVLEEVDDDLCAEHVCLDEDACKSTGDELLGKYAEASTLKKVLSNNVPALERGIYLPIHTSYGLGETGRTTSSNPPIQNLTNIGGVKESFVPRPEHLFAACDFPQLELYAWAQCCLFRFGHSKMAEALNAGLDPHLWYAAIILDTTYEDVVVRYEAGEQLVADIRQVCKIGNFGWPGGMWPPTFTRHLRRLLGKALSERLGINEEKVTRWRDQWFEAWPEAHDFFDRVKKLLDPIVKVATVTTIFTNRIRGGARFCAACNNDFQGLGVDCAKEAGWRIADAQYEQPKSALYNTRTVFFVHDEFGVECLDDERAHDVAFALADTMREGANLYLPDVPIPKEKMKPVLMRQWNKKAKQVFQEGRLVPWQP